MAGLLLFFPSERVEKDLPALFARTGLAELLDPHDDQPGVVEDLIPCGPSRTAGTLCHWPTARGEQAQPVIASDRQTWYEAKPRDGLPKGRVWIGYETARRPRPVDLQRTKLHPGQAVRLADGQDWLVPIVRELPQLYGYDDDGELATRFDVPRYQDVFDRTWQWCERIRGAAIQEQAAEGQSFRVSFDRRDYFAYVADLLALHYRINRDVVDALGLLATGDVGLIPFTAGGYLQPEKKS